MGKERTQVLQGRGRRESLIFFHSRKRGEEKTAEGKTIILRNIA